MTAQTPAYFRTVAIDYDGTLADGQVKPDALASLAEARARQIRVIVVTGRILNELQAVFPDAWDHVDPIVAENGAVLATPTGVRLLAAPVDPAVRYA
jgi:hydroxymethylpyrimidine pyrophosphatase-like HAD family hydrolase